MRNNRHRYFIEMSYNGSNYHGWQIQPNAPTVQETINKALSTILRQEINVVGAGRTDTGVHASYFMAHFDGNLGNFTTEYLCYKLNRFLPQDIAVSAVFRVADEAHARFDAVSRTYHYYIDTVKNPFTSDYAYRPYPIPDIDLMNEACRILFDYSDFTSFSKLHTDTKTNNCKIYEAEWSIHGHQLVFRIKADRFLRNMVRAITGTLADVGNGKISLDDFRKIIESKDRGKAGVSVPGKALFLSHIEYPAKIFEFVDNN